MPDLNELRAQVRARQQAANRKINRLKRIGIEITGTEYDVRRDISRVDRYNTRQLQSYLNRLNQFTDRRNRFVNLGGEVVPYRDWQRYQRLETRYNRIARGDISKVADIDLPGTVYRHGRRIRGMTVAERDASFRPDAKARRGMGEAVRRLFEPVNVRPENVNGRQGLEKLIRQREQQLSPDYKRSSIKRQRAEMDQMLDRIGNPEFKELASRLSDDQFYVLWNYGSFATDLSRDYATLEMMATGGSDRAFQKVHEDASRDIKEALQWAQFLPEKAGRKPGKRR